MLKYKGYTIWYNSLQGWFVQSGYEIIGAYNTCKGAKCKVTHLNKQGL